MKATFLSLLLILISSLVSAQISFEPGYFIDNEGDTTYCFIRNSGWKNNPQQFQYSLSENSKENTTSLETVSQFEIFGYKKFRRYTVAIDQSTNDLSKLTAGRKPVWETHTVFLESLLEGDSASLYFYEEETIKRYFYQLGQTEPVQLVYKRYQKEDGNVGINEDYKMELWLKLQCAGQAGKDGRATEYRKKSLLSYFENYNRCSGGNYQVFEESSDRKEKRDLLNVYLRPGLVYSSVSINAASSDLRDTDFGGQGSFSFGIETEFVLPTNENKWSIPFEVTYRYFKAEEEIEFQKVNIDYQSLDFSLAFRYYLFLNETSKLFVNGGYLIGYSFNSIIDFEKSSDLDIGPTNSFFAGIGYNLNNRLSAELRYGFSRNILEDYGNWSNKFPTIALIMGLGIL